jgi:hypothetical protein
LAERAEQKLLLAWDFLGDLMDLVSQPMRLRFTTSSGPASHIPDFLAVTRSGTWLVDVRPAGRISDEDRIKFAASAEVALACGWQYLVVTGWRPQVTAVLTPCPRSAARSATGWAFRMNC